MCVQMSAAASSSPPSDSESVSSLASLNDAIGAINIRANDATLGSIATEVARWMCDDKERPEFIVMPLSEVQAAVDAMNEMRAKLAELAAPFDDDGSIAVSTDMYAVLREYQDVDDFDAKLSSAPGVMLFSTGKEGQFASSHSFNSAVNSAVLRSDTNREVGGSIPVCSKCFFLLFFRSRPVRRHVPAH